MTSIKFRPNSSLVSFLFGLCAFILTRQVPFSSLSPVMNLAVFLMVCLAFINKWITIDDLKIVSIFVIMPLSFNLFYSIALEKNDFGNAIRFYSILILVSLSYYLTVSERAIKWFIIFHIVQVFVLVGIFILLVFIGFNNYTPIRLFFIEKGWGDVYSYSGILYKIQIKGNALLLFSFFLTNEYNFFKRNFIVSMILLLGIVLSGNFTFIIIAFVYLFYRYLNWNRYQSYKKYLFVLFSFICIGCLVSPFIIGYINETLELKKDISLATREDQINVLMDDLCIDYLRLLFGGGLGNTIDVVTPYRDYRGLNYYELQSVYVFNQLGVVFSILFILYNVIVVLRKWSNFPSILIIYFLYLIYSSSNPYLLDTNQVLVIIILNSLIWLKVKNLKPTDVN